jgi:hypothetical protein
MKILLFERMVKGRERFHKEWAMEMVLVTVQELVSGEE